MVLLNLFLCLVLHSKGKLTIYRDYTDAALTFAGLLIPIIALVATKCAELGDSLSYSITAACALIPLLFIFRSTYVHNSNLVYVLMSLMAKLTAIALYVVFLIGNSGSVKRDGGSDISNQNNRSAIAMIIYTALFMLLTRAMTRMRYFAPLHEHVSLSFARIPHDLIVVSDESF
jgi:predicted neutral ceramidase superfamily lipid hydrolase